MPNETERQEQQNQLLRTIDMHSNVTLEALLLLEFFKQQQQLQ